jgi:hypothetical protein
MSDVPDTEGKQGAAYRRPGVRRNWLLYSLDMGVRVPLIILLIGLGGPVMFALGELSVNGGDPTDWRAIGVFTAPLAGLALIPRAPVLLKIIAAIGCGLPIAGIWAFAAYQPLEVSVFLGVFILAAIVLLLLDFAGIAPTVPYDRRFPYLIAKSPRSS